MEARLDPAAVCGHARRPVPQEPDVTADDTPITFVITGQRLDGPRRSGGAAPSAPVPGGRIKASVQVGARRGGGSEQRITAVPGNDVVVLHLTNGPSLTLHPATARDLMMAQGAATRSAAAAGADVPVPAELQWRGLE
jgi:hypothetical protein